MPDDALNLRDLCCPFVLDGQKGHVFEVTFQRLLPNPCDRRAIWSIRYTSMWALLRQASAAWWLSRMTTGSIGRRPQRRWSARSVSRARRNRSSPRPRLPPSRPHLRLPPSRPHLRLPLPLLPLQPRPSRPHRHHLLPPHLPPPRLSLPRLPLPRLPLPRLPLPRLPLPRLPLPRLPLPRLPPPRLPLPRLPLRDRPRPPRHRLHRLRPRRLRPRLRQHLPGNRPPTRRHRLLLLPMQLRNQSRNKSLPFSSSPRRSLPNRGRGRLRSHPSTSSGSIPTVRRWSPGARSLAGMSP
jgi:hypothetical protein